LKLPESIQHTTADATVSVPTIGGHLRTLATSDVAIRSGQIRRLPLSRSFRAPSSKWTLVHSLNVRAQIGVASEALGAVRTLDSRQRAPKRPRGQECVEVLGNLPSRQKRASSSQTSFLRPVLPWPETKRRSS